MIGDNYLCICKVRYCVSTQFLFELGFPNTWRFVFPSVRLLASRRSTALTRWHNKTATRQNFLPPAMPPQKRARQHHLMLHGAVEGFIKPRPRQKTPGRLRFPIAGHCHRNRFGARVRPGSPRPEVGPDLQPSNSWSPHPTLLPPPVPGTCDVAIMMPAGPPRAHRWQCLPGGSFSQSFT